MFVTPHLIGLLHPKVFFPWFYLEGDSIFALAFTDKMAKNLIATKKQQELKFFMHQNSLPAPSLPEQSFSVANESCSGRKKQKKQYPTHSHRQRSTSSTHFMK